VLQALPPHQQSLDDNTPFTPPMSTCPRPYFSAPGTDLIRVWAQYRSQINRALSLCTRWTNARQCDFQSTDLPGFLIMDDWLIDILMLSGTTMQLQKGQIVLTPYAVVEQLLGMGNVELV